MRIPKQHAVHEILCSRIKIPTSRFSMERIRLSACLTGRPWVRSGKPFEEPRLGRSSWTFNWNCCIKNSEGPATQHANLGTKQVVSLWVSHSVHSVAGMLQFPFVSYFTWIPWIFRSVSVSIAGNQMALGSVLLHVLRHTIMTSPTCALTQLHQPRLWFITGGYLVKC